VDNSRQPFAAAPWQKTKRRVSCVNKKYLLLFFTDSRLKSADKTHFTAWLLHYILLRWHRQRAVGNSRMHHLRINLRRYLK